MFAISAPRVLRDGRLAGPATVVVEDGTITAVRDGAAAPGPGRLVLPDGVLTPGLVDLQVNGAFGVDLATATAAGWARLAAALPATGVTAFQPTFISAPASGLAASLDAAAAARARLTAGPFARIIGAHLEGPFLNPARRGAHDPRHLVLPTPAAVDALLAAERGRGIVSMLTLAPELPGALAAIPRLRDAGIRVALGHTDATAATVTAAADAGAGLVTHLFNAQRPLGHREPGVPGAALADPRLSCSLIADLHHVAPAVCQIAWRAAAGRVLLVTDAIAAAGMPPGDYRLSGVSVRLADGAPRTADGTLAGSALTLDLAVRTMIGLGLDPADVLTAATRLPADAAARPDLGRLSPGAAADLVWWSDAYRPRRAWIAGIPSPG